MWIGAPFGWLMPAERPAKYIPKGDTRTLQVRARRSKDLDLLRALYMQGTLGPTVYTADKDYEYRAYCEPADFAAAMFNMVMDIDYAKFKPTTSRFSDDQLHGMYNEMWATISARLSTKKHRDGYWSEYDKKFPPKKYVGGTVSKSDGSTYTSSSPGYPTQSPGKDLAVVESDDGWAGLQKWLYEAELHRPSAYRDTRPDRDEYLPEVWDENDIPSAVASSGIPAVDSLYAEIDKILDDYKNEWNDHDMCAHSPGRAGRRKCNNKRKRLGEAQIRALREEIDQAYRDAEADAAGEFELPVDPQILDATPAPQPGEAITGVVVEPTDDPATWRGYVWDKKKTAECAV
jgi:hypothetical protein